MKSLSSTTAILLALWANVARGHYTFPDFKGDASSVTDWQYVRMTQNHYSQGPVTSVTDPLLRCYENDTASATSSTTATAGNTYSFGADQAIYHPGYTAVYMAQVSDFTSESAGDGSVWFKIFEDAPVYDASRTDFYIFPDETATSVTFTIPKALPSGKYLVRVEQIALHVASSFGGAQFYIGCAQVQVNGGGSGSPGPLVAIPGVYTGNEPGILINIYAANPNGAYISPGPAVWTGSGSSGSGTTTAKTTSTTAKTTSTTAKTSTTTVKTSTTTSKTTSSASSTTTGTVAEYGQCGGIGYTGSTVCASPYTCTYSNAYYSQCL